MTIDDPILHSDPGEDYFFNVYGASSSMVALLHPVRDAFGRIIDLKLVLANDRWSAARLNPVSRGSLIADCYTNEELVLRAAAEACELGSATRFIRTDDSSEVIVGGLIAEVEWRMLPNGLLLEQSRDQTLIAAALEASGPVLIVNMPQEGELPEDVLAVNEAFIELFNPSGDVVLPTLSSGGTKGTVKLSQLRASVLRHFTDDDWDHFFSQNIDIYAGRCETKGLPFFMDGKAYLRDFTAHQLSDGRRVGIWVYRLAGTTEMSHPEFAAARLDGLFNHVINLSRPIAAHRPVFDDDGVLVDVAVVWANHAFNSYRFEPIQRGQLGTETRIRFTESLLPVLQQAWENGEATQFFRFEEGDDPSVYREGYVETGFNAALEMETFFVRTEDDYIIEWGDDVDMKRRLGSELEAQRRTSYEMAVETQKELSKRAEHDRFVRELHDNVLQELFVTGMSISAYADPDAADPTKEQLQMLQEAISKVSTDIRALIAGSKNREGDLLNDQVRQVVEQWDETVTDMKVTLQDFSVADPAHVERMPATVVSNVVNIVRESVSNAVKHSGGTDIRVELNVLPHMVMLSIVDNGNGIDPRNTRASGTVNMAARAASLGGSVDIRNSPNGVTVEALLPYSLEAV